MKFPKLIYMLMMGGCCVSTLPSIHGSSTRPVNTGSVYRDSASVEGPARRAVSRKRCDKIELAVVQATVDAPWRIF